MAQVARAVEVNAPVEVIEAQWQRFESLPQCAARSLVEDVRWRAEVLTFEPIRAGTRITLKVEFAPGGAEARLPHRIEATLQGFVAYLERGRGRALAAPPP